MQVMGMTQQNLFNPVGGDSDEAPRSMVWKVVHGIREMIRSDGLKIDDPLPSEGAIGDQLGVSRAVVREAYRSMSALSLINVGNGRRARVSEVDPGVLALLIEHAVTTDQVSVQQILDVRRTIEMRTVSLATLRRSDKEAKAIAAHAAAMRADFKDAEKVMLHDIAFHEAIAAASRNPLFMLIVGSFHVVTRQTWKIGWLARETDAARLKNVSLHEALAAAVASGDRPRAETLMAEHFDDTVKVLLAGGIN